MKKKKPPLKISEIIEKEKIKKWNRIAPKFAVNTYYSIGFEDGFKSALKKYKVGKN